MKKTVFFVLIFTGFVFSVHAQWGWFGDLLDEAMGNSGTSSGSSSSSQLQSGSYYGSLQGHSLRIVLDLERARFQMYADGEYVGGGTAFVSGNTLTLQCTYVDGTSAVDSCTITSASSFYSNLDGVRYNR